MTASRDRFFVCLSMWSNNFQEYFNVGTLVYDFSHYNSARLVGFSYHKDHIGLNLPAIDPANLLPTIKNRGKFVSREKQGALPHYFASLLPGPFGDDLISDMNKEWKTLTDTEKLYVMTLSHGDFGAPRLNAYKDQNNHPIRDLTVLSGLVTAIREYQDGHINNPITLEIQGALCNMHSHKPMVDFEARENGVERRFVVKLNTSRIYNDAKVSSVLSTAQENSGINACSTRVMKLSNQEDVLFSSNYARTESYDTTSGSYTKIIMKYNRVSFKVLLAEDPFLKKNEIPSYKHIAHAIKKYSADPTSDLEELFSRAFFSAATNHTSNSFSNMEMFDDGDGNWRLSPSFNNLPNPMTNAEFECSFGDKKINGSLLNINEEFVGALAESIGIDNEVAKKLALVSSRAILSIDKISKQHQLDQSDHQMLNEVVKNKQLDKLVNNLAQDVGLVSEIVDEAPNFRSPKF